MGVEYELKFAATPEKLAALRQMLCPTDTVQMRTTYFDTPDYSLAARHMTARLRQENDVTVCTVKMPLPNGGRGEWECRCENIQIGVFELCKLGAPRELEALASKLRPVCGAAFTRHLRLLDIGTGTVEIALDEGVLMGGGRESPLCEMEVELKSGPWEQAADFAACLARSEQLQGEPRSKFSRAMALARGE